VPDSRGHGRVKLFGLAGGKSIFFDAAFVR
jgi:hypothetical protein